MKKLILIITILVNIFIVAGCGERPQVEVREKSMVSTEASSNHFESHFADAGRFLDLKHQGDEFRDQGQYQEAITLYEEALTQHAYSRPEQAIAASRIAETFELARDYVKASEYYRIAAKATMNENQTETYTRKAQELREKATLPTDRH